MLLDDFGAYPLFGHEFYGCAVEVVKESPLVFVQRVEQFDGLDFPWILTPVFNYGEDFPRERVHEIAVWNEARGGHFRVISQQHKWIHGPNKKFI